jgi:hypothetical protein
MRHPEASAAYVQARRDARSRGALLVADLDYLVATGRREPWSDEEVDNTLHDTMGSHKVRLACQSARRADGDYVDCSRVWQSRGQAPLDPAMVAWVAHLQM